MINMKMMREVSKEINRRTNFETANMKKSVQSNVQYKRAIEYLIENKRSGLNLTDGTDAFTLSPTLKNKIYIPYSEYKGE